MFEKHKYFGNITSRRCRWADYNESTRMNPKGKVKKLTKNYLAKELESDSLIGISKLGEKNKILQTLNVMVCSITLKKRNKESEVTLKARII